MRNSILMRLAAAVLLLLPLAQAAGSQEVPASGDIAGIIERGVLRVALPAFDSRPFFYEEPGRGLRGSDVEMAEDIARELGVRARFERTARTFDDVVTAVAEGEADLAVSKLSRTLARARRVQFSHAYASFKHALILNRVAFAEFADGREVVDVMHDYRGSMGVIANSSFAGYARANFPDALVREFPSWEAVVDAVRNGEVVAAYRDEFEVKRLIADDPALSLTLRTITLEDLTDTLGIAVAAQDAHLLSFVNMVIERGPGLQDADDMIALLAIQSAETIPSMLAEGGR